MQRKAPLRTNGAQGGSAFWALRADRLVLGGKALGELFVRRDEERLLVGVDDKSGLCAAGLLDVLAQRVVHGHLVRLAALGEGRGELRGLQDATRSLEATLASVDGKGDFLARATRYCEEVLPIMGEVRRYADLLETRVADDLWDLPSYQEILFGK